MELQCRTCLKITDTLLDIFSDDLPHKIETISSVPVLQDDRFPSKICEGCAKNVHLLYDFRSTIIASNMMLEERYIKKEKDCESDFLSEEDAQSEELNLVPKVEVLLLESTPLKYTDEKDIESKSEGTADCSSMDDSDDKKTQEIVRSICNVCGKLISKYNLKKHILTHTESPVSCKFCGKEFKNSGSLRGHVLIHKGIHYECTECAKIFTNRKGYTDHIKRHKFNSKTIECSMCEKRFYSKYKQSVHMRSHTGERPYPCQYCKKGFSSGNALKTHIRRHTKEKPFACEHCNMAFPQRVSLRTHIKSKHPEQVLEQSSSTPD